MNMSFLTLGGDSISAMQLMSLLREQGIEISIRNILQAKNVAQLAASATTATESSIVVAEEKHDEAFELSPIQQMFFEMSADPKIQFNQSFLLRINSGVSADQLNKAIHAVVERHSMLRARFSRDNNGKWMQHISSDVSSSYLFKVHQASELDQLLPLANATQLSLDIENGPLFAADLVNVDGEGQMIYLVAHHLVIDLVSWRIIMGDLANLMQGQPLSAIKPFPFQAWNQLQRDYAQDSLTAPEVMPITIPAANYAYWGMQGKSNTFRDTGRERFKLDSRVTTMLLSTCHKALKTEAMDIFLAALVHSFEVTFNDRAVPAVFSEGHGRETWSNEIDLSRTVGWFTTISPVHIEAGTDIIETIRRTKDIRRSLPGNGLQYFASRFLNKDCKEAFKSHWPLEILFNYHGQFQQQGGDDSDLQIVPLSTDDFSKDMERLALFDINATVNDGVAEFTLIYNKQSLHQERIAQWMASFRTVLYQAAVRLQYMATDWTLTDFPLLGIDYNALTKLKRERIPALRIQKLDDIEDIYPCSPMQQSILAAHTSRKGFYEINTIFKLTSNNGTPISIPQLHSAWQSMIDRHPILRTLFIPSVSKNALYDQVVLRSGYAKARLQHFESKVEGMQLTTLPELAQLLPNPHDDDPAALPHRLTTVKTPSGVVFVRAEISHALIDGATLQTLLDEFGAAYYGTVNSVPAPLYGDYIKHIQSNNDEATSQYWSQYLREVSQRCIIPTVLKSADKKSPEKELKTAAVPALPKVTELNAYCKENGITLSNLLRTVWAILLSQHAKTSQANFGYIVSGSAETTGMERIGEAVGPFFNLLPCCISVEKDASVIGLLKEMQKDATAALPYQSGFVKDFVDAKALFNSIVNFRKYGSASVDALPESSFDATPANNGNNVEDHIEWKPIRTHDPFEYDVAVEMLEADSAVDVQLKYWSHKLGEKQAEGIAKDYQNVLEKLITGKYSTIKQLI
jgi:non-ribosomal peptide synthase protein (TIGR01720 family)